jgi:RND family efflux transporter MFP subunit
MIMGSSVPAVQADNDNPPVPRQPEADPETPPCAVTVITPRKGAMERLTTQPGYVQAFESVKLFAKVPGFLKKQTVDIGSLVKKGEVLAVVDVPELEKQLEADRAAVERAKSKVRQMEARVVSARADLEAAQAGIKQAQASARSAAAWVRYRTVRFQNMKNLSATNSIEEKIVEEAKEHLEAAKETEQAALAAIVTTKARVTSCTAKIQEAEADVGVAESDVSVAKAGLGKVQVQIDFATIVAPFDGVVTYRSLNPKDFVRAANESGSLPLLTVQRTDLFRVVVQVPDSDVTYADPGDPATVTIGSLPEPLAAKIARISRSQDPKTHLMNVEIDLPNPTGKITDGSYARVTIVLDKNADTYSIPSSCLASKSPAGDKGTVYVVRDGRAHAAAVTLGADSGLRVAVLKGLSADDRVILHPGSAVTEGAAVHATFWDEARAQ